MNNADEIIEKMTSFLKNEANSETIVGKAFQLGEFSCVPVVKIGLGFGFGSGEGAESKDGKKGEGSGAGAGVGIEPIGFLVSRGSEVSFVSTRASKGLNAVLEKAPDLLMKFFENQQEKKTTEKK